jgi:hypothetical protein
MIPNWGHSSLWTWSHYSLIIPHLLTTTFLEKEVFTDEQVMNYWLCLKIQGKHLNIYLWPVMMPKDGPSPPTLPQSLHGHLSFLWSMWYKKYRKSAFWWWNQPIWATRLVLENCNLTFPFNVLSLGWMLSYFLALALQITLLSLPP